MSSGKMHILPMREYEIQSIVGWDYKGWMPLDVYYDPVAALTAQQIDEYEYGIPTRVKVSRCQPSLVVSDTRGMRMGGSIAGTG